MTFDRPAVARTDSPQSNSAGGLHVGQLMQPAPLLVAATPCSAVFTLFQEQPDLAVAAVQLDNGGYTLVDRNTFLIRYLEGYNRDLYARRPITKLFTATPLIVEADTSVDEVGLRVTSEYPEALKSAFLITSGGVYVGVGMGVDLLRTLAQIAQEANVAKTTFLANMSHELRTPLNGVIGNLELLSTTGLDSDQTELANTASTSAATLLQLIGDLLDLSKIEADRLELEMIDCDVRTIINEALAVILPKVRQKGLRLKAWTAANVPALVKSDPLRLRQVLVNFLGNAVKFAEFGGIFLTVRNEAPPGDEARLRFEVLDTGPGFDPARAEKLFEPFVQEEASTTRQHGGTGLGLTIAKRIIELLGGTIGCSTEQGFGSTFFCSVAAAPPLISVPASDIAVHGEDDMIRAVSPVLLQAELQPVAIAGALPFGVPVVVVDTDDGPAPWDILSSLRERECVPFLITSRAGDLDIYQAYRAGAELVLRFPTEISELPSAIASARASTAASKAGPVVEQIDFGGLPVLVLDDTRTNRDLATRQLKRFGLVCDTAENGQVGLDISAGKNYALIFVDGSMPVMDGVTFARAFRERESGQRTPLIAMTAHAIAGDKERFLASGMDDYLAKPVTLEKLRAKVLQWLKPDAALPVSPSAPQAASAGGLAPSGAGIDRSALVELIGEDEPELIGGLLSVFLTEFPAASARVAAALASRSRGEIKSAAHAAKSAAGSVGAVALAALLKKIEHGAAEKEFAELETLRDAVAAAFTAAAMDARQMIDATGIEQGVS